MIIGFVTDSYNVRETDGPVAMMLSILDGEIAEGVEISVNFFTQDGTAIGKTIVIILCSQLTASPHLVEVCAYYCNVLSTSYKLKTCTYSNDIKLPS